MANTPETQYAKSGDLSIAYQTFGKGPVDIVFVPGIVSHLDIFHELPGYTEFFNRLGQFARVTTFDKRGQGLSDRIEGYPTLEVRMDDVKAVMDAVGIKKATLMGLSEGGPMSLLFAATYPNLIEQLIIFGSFAKSGKYPNTNYTPEELNKDWIKNWGDGSITKYLVPIGDPRADDPDFKKLTSKFQRNSTTPKGILQYSVMNQKIDIEAILPSIHVPTLILHRKDDNLVLYENGQYLAEHIPGAELVSPGNGGHIPWFGDTEACIKAIEKFVTGTIVTHHMQERVLSTVLFTDIVDSTKLMSSLGDDEWHIRLDKHDDIVKNLISDFNGNLIKTTGDGVLATFDGPGRAIQCATDINNALAKIELQIRSGIHTGEIELRDNDIAGMAVHAAARIESKAQPGEILVSEIVTNLVIGSDIVFNDKEYHDLKGLPGKWCLLSVA